MLTIKKIKNLKDKKVFLRVDFNVPVEGGKVADDFKIQKSLPTINYLLKKGARIVLASHLGRPKNREEKYGLEPVRACLQKLLKQKIKLFDLEESEKIDSFFEKNQIALLENIRFYAGEKENNRGFAKKLAGLADIFVLDGFAVSHRASASVVGVGKILPAYAGLLLEEEVKSLSKLMKNPCSPFVLILGGVKMETKIPVLKKMLPLVDNVLLGGGIVNTYLKAKGFEVGSSLYDKDFTKEALFYGEKNKVIKPLDLVVGDLKGQKTRVVDIDGKRFKLKKGELILDIGPRTINLYAGYIKKARTLLWNGAMGYFEQKPYQYGTYSIARLLAARSKGTAYGVCGGGETVEVLRKLKILEDVDFVSTGGGAMLEFLSGKKLPGIKQLQ